jgi:hypothetical protein
MLGLGSLDADNLASMVLQNNEEVLKQSQESFKSGRPWRGSDTPWVWRKYGKKVNGNPSGFKIHPSACLQALRGGMKRDYYKCSKESCPGRKHVDLSADGKILSASVVRRVKPRPVAPHLTDALRPAQMVEHSHEQKPEPVAELDLFVPPSPGMQSTAAQLLFEALQTKLLMENFFQTMMQLGPEQIDRGVKRRLEEDGSNLAALIDVSQHIDESADFVVPVPWFEELENAEERDINTQKNTQAALQSDSEFGTSQGYSSAEQSQLASILRYIEAS